MLPGTGPCAASIVTGSKVPLVDGVAGSIDSVTGLGNIVTAPLVDGVDSVAGSGCVLCKTWAITDLTSSEQFSRA